MASFKHEITNRKKLVNKDEIRSHWKSLKCIYPVKCAVCHKWIDKNAQILWHRETRMVMHQDC